MSRLRFLLAISALLATSVVYAQPPRRVLHVSLYPYIPDAPAAALTLKQAFERAHPDVIVDISFNQNYYSPDPADHGVLFETADVHEIDVIFLRDFLDRHKLAPLSAAFTAQLDKFVPLAAQAATVGGRLVAVPQWMCTDFLIYHAGQTGLGSAPGLADLEHALASHHGLLMDMKGANTLGEYYLSALLARDGSPDAAVAHITPKPDTLIMARMRRILALEPPGYGRDAGYHERGDFYARQFARRAGSAYVGYSETIHDVLDETEISCRNEDRCITAPDIGVAAFPFQDGKVHPAIWVDMFGIDAKVHGQTRIDAQDFIQYAVSISAYRALLVPTAGTSPRYLLPATENAFTDPEILAAAPLYPKFRAIMDQGAVVTVPHLNADLHEVAAKIDAELPARH